MAFDNSEYWDHNRISALYCKKAAEHQCSKAQLAYGIICKKCWDNWRNAAKEYIGPNFIDYIEAEGLSLADIYAFYDDAKYWLIEALKNGEDQAAGMLSELISTKEIDGYPR